MCFFDEHWTAQLHSATVDNIQLEIHQDQDIRFKDNDSPSRS